MAARAMPKRTRDGPERRPCIQSLSEDGAWMAATRSLRVRLDGCVAIRLCVASQPRSSPSYLVLGGSASSSLP